MPAVPPPPSFRTHTSARLHLNAFPASLKRFPLLYPLPTNIHSLIFILASFVSCPTPLLFAPLNTRIRPLHSNMNNNPIHMPTPPTQSFVCFPTPPTSTNIPFWFNIFLTSFVHATPPRHIHTTTPHPRHARTAFFSA